MKKIVMLAICIAAVSPLCAQSNTPSEVIILETTIGTDTCYVGEAIPVTVSWSVYPPIGTFKAVDIRLPLIESQAFKAYDSHKTADQPNSKSLGIPISGTRAIANLKTTRHGNHNYTSLRIKKVVMPTTAGTHTIEPTTITCAIDQRIKSPAKTKNNVRSAGNLYQYPLYFDNNFFNKELIPSDIKLKAASAGNTLKVLPLPRNAPEMFSGLTGQYQFSVNISTNTIRQGDPLTLNLTIASKGYLAHVEIPPLELQPNLTNSFRVASDRRLRAISNDNIVFTQTVYPIHHGEQEFPSLSFCYFNPTTKQYAISRSKKIPLTVEKANIIDGSILGLKEKLQDSKFNPFRWILALVFIAILTAVIYARYAHTDHTIQEEVVDLSEAYRQFQKTIAMLKKTNFETTRDEHNALNSALVNILAAYLPTHKPGAITFSDVDELLTIRNASKELRTKTRALFREMDMCRFSPAAPTMTYEKAVTQALEIVAGMGQSIAVL